MCVNFMEEINVELQRMIRNFKFIFSLKKNQFFHLQKKNIKILLNITHIS
jgi:hypothetical protein